MLKPHGRPQPIEAHMQDTDMVEQEESVGTPVPQDDKSMEKTDATTEAARSHEWWRGSEPGTEATEASEEALPAEDADRKDAAAADVYFCAHTGLFPLSRALRAISQERLAGVLRASWEEAPIELLARDGEIIFVTTRDSDVYCPEIPQSLANIDVVKVEQARARQRETGTPFFLSLAREELISLDAATDLMRHHGQSLFCNLWTVPRIRITFEKNPALLADVADVPGDPDVRDWALETLRLVQNTDKVGSFEPASIPAYTKDGFERVQRLKLNRDEAQFASQFNGARSVQQIAKNLRLDLKSTRQLLFRFLALEIVECWPASTAAKPEKPGLFKRLGRRDR